MKFLVSSAFLYFLFVSCHKADHNCEDAKNTVVDLRSDELEKVPYTGFDTVYFLDQSGDTNIVRGTGKIFAYDIEYGFTTPDCPQNQIIQKQSCLINFVSIKGDLNFSIKQSIIDRSLTIRKLGYPIYFNVLYNIIGVEYKDDPYYLGSVKINNVVYKKVSKLVPFLHPPLTDIDSNYTLLYNQESGVLFIKSVKDQEEFSLINK